MVSGMLSDCSDSIICCLALRLAHLRELHNNGLCELLPQLTEDIMAGSSSDEVGLGSCHNAQSGEGVDLLQPLQPKAAFCSSKHSLPLSC